MKVLINKKLLVPFSIMKLQTLHEQKTNQIDVSKYTENLSAEDADMVKEFLDIFKGFTRESADIFDEDMYIHVTNGIVEFDFTFEKEAGDNGYFPTVTVANMVASKYILFSDQLSENDYHKMALMESFDRNFRLKPASKDKVLNLMRHWVKVAEEFTDWYFDLSGKYGKLKLVKTGFNPKDGSSDSNWKWLPIGGYFHARTNLNSNIEREVF